MSLDHGCSVGFGNWMVGIAGKEIMFNLIPDNPQWTPQVWLRTLAIAEELASLERRREEMKVDDMRSNTISRKLVSAVARACAKTIDGVMVND